MNANPVVDALERRASTLAGAETLYIAYSGGLDSTVLLHACMQRFPGRVRVLHGNHGLHGEARAWVRHCENLCAAWKLPLQSETLNISDRGEGLESAARSARYAWFESLLGANDILLMAHHQDDQAETLLLRLLRGAGPEGLAAMPEQRPLGAGQLLRPLLELPRAELERYAALHELSWVDDPSNEDEAFDRNYLRHRVMPLLEARWPAYRATVGRSARHLAQWLAHAGAGAPALIKSPMGDPGFALAELSEDPAAAAILVRQWLRERGLQAPPAARLGEFLRQVREGKGARLQAANWALERYRDAVYAYRADLPKPSGEVTLTQASSLAWPAGGEATVTVAFSQPARLSIRSRRAGDRLATASGQHRDLKHLFQELGVPPWWRDKLPLIVRGEGDASELLAVGHLAQSPDAAALGLRIAWKPGEMP